MHFEIFLTEFIFFLFGRRMLASERVGMSKLILDPLPFFLSAPHAVYFIVLSRSSFHLHILHFLLLLKFCNLLSPLHILHLELAVLDSENVVEIQALFLCFPLVCGCPGLFCIIET